MEISDAERSLAGVRLSYAISEWIDLGEVYPPARRALESVRDTKAESLMQGTYDASLFHDVASINRALGQVERTRDLFRAIAGADHGLAEKCFHFVLESLVHTKEYGLARSFLPESRKDIDQFLVPLKLALQSTGSVSQEMLEETLVRIYVERVNLILQVFIGVGEEDVPNCFGIESWNGYILRGLPHKCNSFGGQLLRSGVAEVAPTL